ncbi:MAG: NAD(+) synthase [Candidatus Spyradenecus sp.]
MKGFVRVAAVTPKVQVAAPAANARALVEALRAAADQGAQVAVAPELSLTGYTCSDLFGMSALESQVEAALAEVLAGLPEDLVAVVGLPIRWEERLYNCAAVLQAGRVLGLVPKVHLPTYREFYEKRHFVSGATVPEGATWRGIPFGTDLLFELGDLRFGVEICEDLWAVDAPSNRLAAARAQLIVNLSASTEAVGKAAYRRDLVRMQSARLACAYAYAAAGMGESTTDVVYSGHRLLANNGRILAEARWSEGISLMDFNPHWVDVVRGRETSFPDLPRVAMRRVVCRAPAVGTPCLADGSLAGLEAHPFVPANDTRRTERCREIFRIQVAGLAKRFTHTHSKRLVIGLSGGLDSTLALLVCAQMCRALGLPGSTILAVTMPGFGTSKRTRSNAGALAELLGAELREISIVPGVEQHFRDIGHDPACHDVTYENAQARARTYLLMDLANQSGGLLVGTGDLSEIALGWSTYNGDHMSMYAVNCGVPKTLVRWCVETVARESPADLAAVLRDICATPVSPELLPGEQHTEAIVGQYELHDFFLYYFQKFACSRAELADLARLLLGSQFPPEEIDRTLDIFARRFVQQQFKRSAIPDGPKVGTIALSPRGDWRMPSDAAFAL